jgi:hypothetical protein
MKTYEYIGAEVDIHVTSTSRCFRFLLERKIPGVCWVVGYVGYRDDVNDLAKGEISASTED